MDSKGFTLVELIVTILLVGMLATMAVPYYLSGVTRGAEPLNDMPTPLGVQTIMANIAANYSSNGTYLHDLSQFANSITTGNYGLTASHTIIKDLNFKFDEDDVLTALKVTIKHNSSGQSATFVFTRQQ
ncbi:MAG: type IV pilin protein [Thermodesulfobacteriota bacterium]